MGLGPGQSALGLWPWASARAMPAGVTIGRRGLSIAAIFKTGDFGTIEPRTNTGEGVPVLASGCVTFMDFIDIMDFGNVYVDLDI